ncbi:MAG: hypothetical protein GTN39_02035, partial [Candidatus Aenigmarchaeota archaeon]|nr:hypothetical protein [Candidatus Aenigmarchaeota archaeon]NIQ17266.1 hypothetical protein [Candidatus Aenigmarchaeota archaeon]
KNNGCGETSGLECCIQTSLLGGDGYGPGASKIGLSSPVFLQECINCVVNEKKPWCIESNKCEPCDYQISTEESCRALYQEVTVEGEEPETPLPGSIIPGPAYDIPSPTMPTTEIVNMLNQQIQEAENKGKTAKNWWEAVGALIAFGALFALAVWWLSGKVKGEGTSEYTNALAKGMRYGLICLVLQIVGGWLSGKEGAVETIGEGMTGFGDILYNVCIFLAENFPALIALLSVVMRWITFEACMEDIERSLDQGYYGSGEGASAYRSGLVGTRSALSKLDACMNQFNQISQDAWRIGQSMYYSGVGLWGSASFRLYKTKPSEKEITGTATICKDEPVRYKFKNWCKVIMEKGHDAQFIKITSSSGNECNPETIISAEYCRGQYGYGYGWGSGWGTGGYRPLYQAPGSSKDDFIPVNQCPEDDKNTGYTYTISVPGVSQYYTLEYDPTC